MGNIIEYWLKHVDFDEIKDKITNRKVVVWGAYDKGKQIESALLKKGIVVEYYIDGHKESEEYNNHPIIRPTMIQEIENIYIIVAVIGIREEIIYYLRENKMQEYEDYLYISQMVPRVVITECRGRYSDSNGNCIEFEDKEIRCKIEMIGYDNHVIIGRGLEVSKKAHLILQNGSKIVLGRNLFLRGKVKLEAENSGSIVMGDCCRIYDDSRISSKGAEILIQDYVTIGERFFCSSGKFAGVTIGKDCMFAADVSVISGGHSIIDLKRKENYSLKNENSIKIGKHVWLGKNAIVLCNSNIGKGSIVGANSTVKIETEENCVIIGNPAKVAKSGYTWDRKTAVAYEEL